MKIIIQKGSYVEVPDDYLIAFWGSTDCALSHGYMSLCTDNYYGSQQYVTGKVKPKSSYPIKPGPKKWVGKVIPYKHPKSGRKIVALFDRRYFLDKDPKEKDVIRCLKGLKKLMTRGKIRAVSMHPNWLGSQSLEILVHDIFEETKFGILIRY